MHADEVVAILGNRELAVLKRDEGGRCHIRGRYDFHAGGKGLGGILLGGLHLKTLRIAAALCMRTDAEMILLAGNKFDSGRDKPVVTGVVCIIGIAHHAAVECPGTSVAVSIDDSKLTLCISIIEVVGVRHIDLLGLGLLGTEAQSVNVGEIVHAVLGGIEHDKLTGIERQRLRIGIVGHGEGRKQCA